jgi:hypothetical protein
MTRRSLPVLVALFAATLVLASPAPVRAADPIQPGDFVGTSLGGCTLSFVFDGLGANTGRVYLGTAAHCVEQVGDAVQDEFGAQFGTVALIGNPDDTAEDFAFIEVAPAFVSQVSPAVKGWAQYPTGSTIHSETAFGDLLQLSGYGVGFDLLGPTREQRVGVLTFDDAETYRLIGPDTFGDSGGPIVHKRTGRAFGIVSRLCIGLCTSEGATVEGILAKAAARGFPVQLRTV